ncbi:MAG: metallophosphoesterase family protein [Gemmatimonadales bacterium]
MPPKLVWPDFDKSRRGAGYWLLPANLAAGRRRFRSDHSNEWRYEFQRMSTVPPPPPGNDSDPAARSRTFSWLIGKPASEGFRGVILGDTGEGDASQYALLPIVRALEPDFLIINGDVAYPAGEEKDYADGFFEPYRDLRLPIWAVPGNHDYYSAHRGREFHEIFCTEIRRAQWDRAGLCLRPQPGTYWELKERDGGPNLVLLGVDSGHSADLDGKRRFLGLGTGHPPDHAQEQWLEWRLRLAQEAGAGVLILYHIPALVREHHVKATHLRWLHRLIAQFPCVRVVVAAHEHNYQRYAPSTFARYVEREHGTAAVGLPEYLVAGAGGAYISASDFDDGKKTGYVAVERFPTAADWKTWAPLGLKLVAKAGMDKSLVNRATIGLVTLFTGLAEDSDADRPERLSFLVLEYQPATGVTLRPVFVHNLMDMYGHLPDGTPVQVQQGTPPIDPAALATCLQPPVPI